MSIKDFALDGGISKDQIDTMNEKALYLVENIGMILEHLKKMGIHEWFSTQDGDEVDPQILGLLQDSLDQIVLKSGVSLLSERVAPGTFQIALPGRA